ncbi:MAG: PspC domain-containing protein [Chitinophagaceae bacterium]|nr:PspC domain-containing protein [Chitinophagaceae bacterium]
MKKVININFQGQVIPIEETAYEMLQNYVASLRTYFANEEGRDEIINDIESRIAELFAEQLKKGAACITDAEVNRIMDSMGRPEDFEANDEGAQHTGGSQQQESTFAGGPAYAEPEGRGRLYRDEQDKVIGGVASGLANYFKIDPAIIRVLFVALFFGGGSGLLIYIILWIILPSRSLITNIRKRLYRDPDEKVIAGVAGGLAKYFDISPAIPRVIFAAPFIIGIISSIFDSVFWGFPTILGSFGGGTFIMAYIILWIVLPEARTAAEKLEMKGEKVDLNSIRDTVVGDLEGLKTRAQAAGKEFAEKAQQTTRDLQEKLSDKNVQMANELRYAATGSSNGLANAIAILVKAFVYFIVGIIALALFMASIGLLVGGVSIYPLHDFLLQGTTQHVAAWGTIILFLGIPVIALLVFIIRRLMGVKKSNPYIGYGFTALWVLGLVCFLTLIGSMRRSFLSEVGVRHEVSLQQPSGNILKVMHKNDDVVIYDRWFDMDGVMNISKDTLYLNTVKISVVKSKDSSYHAYLMKISKGRDRTNAESLAGKIEFPVSQEDSILYLPKSFNVSRDDKWRNQKVMVVIEVPEGKQIELDESLEDYDYFNIQFSRHRRNGNVEIDWENDWDTERTGEPLQMTPRGLERLKIIEREQYRYQESDDTETPGDTTTPVNEKKESETYRYSLISKERSAKWVAEKIKVPTNPLNAMLRF